MTEAEYRIVCALILRLPAPGASADFTEQELAFIKYALTEFVENSGHEAPDNGD